MIGEYNYGTGRRKTSVARVFLKRGNGRIIVNGKPVDEYFAREDALKKQKIALERGLRRLVLETGVLQPEAIGLYVTEGYLLIDNYPPYEDNDSSRCFAKSLV